MHDAAVSFMTPHLHAAIYYYIWLSIEVLQSLRVLFKANPSRHPISCPRRHGSQQNKSLLESSWHSGRVAQLSLIA